MMLELLPHSIAVALALTLCMSDDGSGCLLEQVGGLHCLGAASINACLGSRSKKLKLAILHSGSGSYHTRAGHQQRLC